MSADLVERLKAKARDSTYKSKPFNLMMDAAEHIHAQNELIQEMRKAILSMVYDDNGVWRAGIIGDMEAPEEVGIALSKAKSQQEGETE